jgi:hypothetical protein
MQQQKEETATAANGRITISRVKGYRCIFYDPLTVDESPSIDAYT